MKFYLRGLGIGILVTAVIMGIASSRKRQMTDEEIKARAKELGMVESMVLADMASASPQGDQTPSQAPDHTPKVSQAPENSPEISQTPENAPEETPTVTPSPENTPAASVSPSPSPEASAPEDSSSPEAEPETNTGETVTITIYSGQSSVAVSRMLEEAGLVESASAYDKYLCDNGYDKRLKTGTHVIPIGASEEEIARIITSRG